MAFHNRIRLPFFLSKPQFPVIRNVFTKSDGSSKVLSVIVKNTYEGKSDYLPEDWHRKFIIALSHDEVNIEDQRYLGGVVQDGEYAIDWNEFLNNPVAQSTFTIQVTPFDATNNNCVTCDEISQLALVDDTTEDIFEEGSTNDFPFSVLLNDNICCYPYELTISSYNTTYFSDVSISATGIITFTVLDPVPVQSNLLLATYRVTCPNGAYDEANVYVNINGTSTECIPCSNLSIDFDDEDDTLATLSWFGPDPEPAGGYDWNLYLASDLFTPIQSGNVALTTVDITGLTPGVEYVFTVASKCGEGDVSTTIQIQWTQNSIEPGSCARFLIYLNAPGATVNLSYLDCDLEVVNEGVNSYAPITRCMRITPGGTTPTFFASSSPSTTIEYITLC